MAMAQAAQKPDLARNGPATTLSAPLASAAHQLLRLTSLNVVVPFVKVAHKRRCVQEDLEGAVEEAGVADVVQSGPNLVRFGPPDGGVDRREERTAGGRLLSSLGERFRSCNGLAGGRGGGGDGYRRGELDEQQESDPVRVALRPKLTVT